MRLAFDTNFLAYAEGVVTQPEDQRKANLAIEILARLPASAQVFVPVQVLLELHYVLTRRLRLGRAEAGRRVGSYRGLYETIDTNAQLLDDAIALARDSRLQIFDSAVLAAAASVDCSILLSEDMHEGLVWRGVRIVNPFREDATTIFATLEIA